MTQAEMSAGPDGEKPVLVAIGDIHGRYDLLDKLIAKLDRKLKDKPYKLIFLGDYIDRGPESREVIAHLIALGESRPDTVFLKGNHEEAMLDFLGEGEVAEAWLTWGGEQTLASYGIQLDIQTECGVLQEQLAAALPDTHFNFLMKLKRIHKEGDFLFVHAGLNPNRPWDNQLDRDLFWIRDPFFDLGEGKFDGLTIVHGHTPKKRAENLPWRINVDTGAVWSSKLTAVILEGGKRSFVST